MQPLIKWPGGKSTEIEYIKDMIPSYKRYVEPFLGGGAVYFYLEPSKALINDISENLTQFYSMIGNGDNCFKEYMYELNRMWDSIKIKAKKDVKELVMLFNDFKSDIVKKEDAKQKLNFIAEDLIKNEKIGIVDSRLMLKEIKRMIIDKFFRTYKNEIKNEQSLSKEDLKENLLTGIASGIYMAVRTTFNQLEKQDNLITADHSKKIAMFYFIREFCYGSMFRYNKSGDFNIPYGGKGYNHKNYKKKLDLIFSTDTTSLLHNAEIRCGDFVDVISEVTEDDFMFLDPPYDTDFSDYENKSFDKQDQARLAKILETTKAKFILIIKNTSFIYNLYNKECFQIKSFDNTYAYCVKNRNNRKVEHLIITNY